jgi:phospholipid/cholesterol/gamma-HCH transport system permease protein
MNAFFNNLGGLFLFLRQVIHTTATTKGNGKAIMAQVASVSYRSLFTVVFAGVFVGAILVLQFNMMLEKYGAQSFLGGLNSSALVREVGPLIISFLLAGKIGAFTAAELGTMRVTEQIDAIQCLGTDPIQYLIVPRFMGIVISTLILLVVGLLVGILGSMFVADVLFGINFLQFSQSLSRFTGPWTIFGGVFKSFTYGTIVALVSCYQGYNTTGGARGVGRAVTLASVYTNLYIVIANFVTSEVLSTARIVAHSLMGRGIG